MNLFRGGATASRELLRQPEHLQDDTPPLTLTQVGLGQSRGYLTVREMPDGAASKRWCVVKENRLWVFDAPDTTKTGASIPLENAEVVEGGGGRTDQVSLSTFHLRTHRGRGRHYVLQAKSSGEVNMWISSLRSHTAKETENQIMARADEMVTQQEQIAAARMAQQARKVRAALSAPPPPPKPVGS
mmetsp:Transcript_20967/g.50617  ORF Transcript_20967/g.50617 Transcript_20967/m.50617 type:complete len:186 (+) Transcript_20967:259-816(+)